MAYFDSEKNKALWEKRMAGLRSERDRRKLEGYKPNMVGDDTVTEASGKNPNVRVITLKELMAKEAARHAAEKAMESPEKKIVKRRTKELQMGTMSK